MKALATVLLAATHLDRLRRKAGVSLREPLGKAQARTVVRRWIIGAGGLRAGLLCPRSGVGFGVWKRDRTLRSQAALSGGRL